MDPQSEQVVKHFYEQDLFTFLKREHIATHTIEHSAAMTIQDIESVALPGPACKNLFLKDSTKKLWLVVALPDTKISLKELAKILKAPELRFAQADLLKEHLQSEPGAVSLFCLINDHEKKVTVVLDTALFMQERVGFHPLRNTATTMITPDDVVHFLKACGAEYREVDFREA